MADTLTNKNTKADSLLRTANGRGKEGGGGRDREREREMRRK
jgi:hypothetical protein